MRTYKVNQVGEKLYQLECINFTCKYNPESVYTFKWSKEFPKLKCEKCGRDLVETNHNVIKSFKADS